MSPCPQTLLHSQNSRLEARVSFRFPDSAVSDQTLLVVLSFQYWWLSLDEKGLSAPL